MSGRGARTFSPLESAGGTTTIADAVVSQIAGMAAGEVEGVRLGGSASRRAGGKLDRVKGSSGKVRGVSVEVGRTEVAVDLKMGVEFGADLPDLTRGVREKVVNRIENLVGLAVTEVNVTITDIIFFEQEEQGGQKSEVHDGETPGEARAGQEDEAEPDRVPDGEPGARERGITRVEPSFRTHFESERGPVPEEEVRVEDVPVGTDEVAELDAGEGKVEKRPDESRGRRKDEPGN